MKWGIRRYQPYPKGYSGNGREVGDAAKNIKFSEVKKEISDLKNSYRIKDEKGNTASELTIYDFDIKGFDWLLMADVETSEEYRGRGLATKLIKQVENDISNNKKGIYLLVESTNKPAISLYDKNGFDVLKTYDLKGKTYYIMIKGRADRNQFKNMDFS